MKVAECSFVVVDCETTGFHPSAHHRVIELALVPVAADGRRGEPWCSLLDPGRDLGATDVHGVRGRDLRDAPRFEDVLGEILDRLAGSVVVAHNARFDCAFLEHELTRAAVDVSPLPALCTMELAGRLGRGGSRLRLRDCCEEAGIPPYEEHTAAGDALACAALLASFLPILAEAELTDLGCCAARSAAAWPSSPRRAAPKMRAQRFGPRREPSFLATLVRAAETPVGADTSRVAPYLDILDRALEDRRLSGAEQEDLAATATLLGLPADRVRALHADYVGTLIALAYRDGVVTEREREDLDLVADALGVDGVDVALERLCAGPPAGGHAGGGALAGKSVCFTGALLCEHAGEALTRERAQMLAERAGLVVADRVTRNLDVLVVADPDTRSGKARKARDYGTRIIAETAFWPIIGVDVC